MKNVIVLLSVLAITLSFPACKKKETKPSDSAFVMFVNGCAGASNVDVAVNNAKLNSASNLGFAKNSGYQSITAAANIPIAFSLTSTGTPLVNGTQTLAVNGHYSAFVGGLVSGTSTCFVFSTDDLTAPASGMAKVRFVNLSSDSLHVSCYIGNQKLDSNVTITKVTPFYSITAATAVKVLLQDPASPTKLAELSNQNFSAGKIYTIMLTGTSAGTSVSVLTLTMINNN